MAEDSCRPEVKVYGMRFMIDGRMYTCVDETRTDYVFVETEAKGLVCISRPKDAFLDDLGKGPSEPVETQGVTVDLDGLSEAVRAKYDKESTFIAELMRLYRGRVALLCERKRKLELNVLREKYGLEYTRSLTIIERYLKSMQMVSILDQRHFSSSTPAVEGQRKRGPRALIGEGGLPPSNAMIRNFDNAIRLWKSEKHMTITDAYDIMLSQMYTTCKGPSWSQFYHYFTRHVDKVTRHIRQKGYRDYMANYRVQYSNSRKDSCYPGANVWVDAVEPSIALVSMFDSEIPVGRPSTYFLVDGYSNLILATSSGLDKNAWVGCSMALANLMFDDHAAIMRERGLRDDVWPSGVLPDRITCDNGSDFISDQMEAFSARRGVAISTVPAAMGSYKGIVEGLNHEFQMFLRSVVGEKYGITSDEYGDKGRVNASLTLKDYEDIVLRFLEYHNTKTIIKYPRSEAMRKARLEPSPINLWRFGIEHMHGAGRVPENDRMAALFDIMKEDVASLTDKGVSFEGLLYKPVDDPLLQSRIDNAMFVPGRQGARNPAKDFVIRFDPRSIRRLYYLQPSGRVSWLELNPDKQDLQPDMDWKTYMQLRKSNSKQSAAWRRANRRAAGQAKVAARNQVAAKEPQTLVKFTDVKTFSRDERLALHVAENLSTKIDSIAPPAQEVNGEETREYDDSVTAAMDFDLQ